MLKRHLFIIIITIILHVRILINFYPDWDRVAKFKTNFLKAGSNRAGSNRAGGNRAGSNRCLPYFTHHQIRVVKYCSGNKNMVRLVLWFFVTDTLVFYHFVTAYLFFFNCKILLIILRKWPKSINRMGGLGFERGEGYNFWPLCTLLHCDVILEFDYSPHHKCW